MPSEITIIIKGDDRTFKADFLNYSGTDGEITLTTDCKRLKELVNKARSEFVGEPETIIIKAKYVWNP